MKKLLTFTIVMFGLLTVSRTTVRAQMMGQFGPPPDTSTIQAQQAEEQEGKKLLDELNNEQNSSSNKTTSCQQLTYDDFDKIGEYFMGQSIGDTTRHIAMNNMMKSMMGETGEAQMHITWGKRGSGCDTSASFGPMMRGGDYPMMGYGGMMGGSGWMMGAFGIFGLVSSILVIIVLVLLAVYLWKQIQKK